MPDLDKMQKKLLISKILKLGLGPFTAYNWWFATLKRWIFSFKRTCGAASVEETKTKIWKGLRSESHCDHRLIWTSMRDFFFTPIKRYLDINAISGIRLKDTGYFLPMPSNAVKLPSKVPWSWNEQANKRARKAMYQVVWLTNLW